MKEEVIHAKGGQIIKLDGDLAEVIVSEGIQVTADMVDECGQLLLDNFKCPCRILINRKNSYHYSFEAQQRLANLECVHSVAVLSHTRSGEITAKIVQMFPGKATWKLAFFADRASALEWLDNKKQEYQHR